MLGKLEESPVISRSDLRQLIDFIGEGMFSRSRDLSLSEIRIKLTQAFGEGLFMPCFSVKALIRVFLSLMDMGSTKKCWSLSEESPMSLDRPPATLFPRDTLFRYRAFF